MVTPCRVHPAWVGVPALLGTQGHPALILPGVSSQPGWGDRSWGPCEQGRPWTAETGTDPRCMAQSFRELEDKVGTVALSEGYPSGQLLRPTWKSFIPRPFISTSAACQGCPLSPRLPVSSVIQGLFRGPAPLQSIFCLTSANLPSPSLMCPVESWEERE